MKVELIETITLSLNTCLNQILPEISHLFPYCIKLAWCNGKLTWNNKVEAKTTSANLTY